MIATIRASSLPMQRTLARVNKVVAMPALRFDELPFGFSWTIDEPLARTSHAIADDDGRVWLIDPTDEPEALTRAAALGTPAGVVQLLDRHNRGCSAIAVRLGVPHVKAWEHAPTGPGPFEVVPVLAMPGWREVALWWPARRALVVAETLGTTPVMAPGADPAGVHPMLRLLPPRGLAAYAPDHLLVGHGTGVHGSQAAAAPRQALAHARSDLPRMLAKLPGMLRR